MAALTQEFLVRLFRDRAHAGHAPDRQQRNALHVRAEPHRHEAVAQFVKHNAEEQADDQGNRPKAGMETVNGPAQPCDPEEQEDEREMHPNGDAPDTTHGDRPFHEGLSACCL